MKVAVLGLGSAGQRHAADASELGHAITAFDPDETRATPQSAERAGSLEAALDGADAAIVATPNRLHAEQALAALAAGVPVLVEKPLASTIEDGERLVAAADGSKHLRAVAMNLRFHTGVAELRRLLDEGELDPSPGAVLLWGDELRRYRPDTECRASCEYEVFTHAGETATGLDPVEWARRGVELGAGEILITSIDREGTMQGYDLELTRAVADAVTVPVIAHGGCGSLEHLVEAIDVAHADAVSCASMLHFTDQSVIKARAHMKTYGVDVRIA